MKTHQQAGIRKSILRLIWSLKEYKFTMSNVNYDSKLTPVTCTNREVGGCLDIRPC